MYCLVNKIDASFMRSLKQMQGQCLAEARGSGTLRKVALLARARSPHSHTRAYSGRVGMANGLPESTTRTGQDYLASSASVVPFCTGHLWQPVATVDAASLQLSCPLVLQRPAELCAAAAAGTDPVLHHAFASLLPDCKQENQQSACCCNARMSNANNLVTKV